MEKISKKKETRAISPAPNIEEGLAEYMWIAENTPQSPMTPMRCVEIQYRDIEFDVGEKQAVELTVLGRYWVHADLERTVGAALKLLAISEQYSGREFEGGNSK
uniref:Uncharacterized protein n=1 Tax=Glossina pallidipes TaxID=7398 RepID=A0A1B0A8L4_GLOPL